MQTFAPEHYAGDPIPVFKMHDGVETEAVGGPVDAAPLQCHNVPGAIVTPHTVNLRGPAARGRLPRDDPDVGFSIGPHCRPRRHDTTGCTPGKQQILRHMGASTMNRPALRVAGLNSFLAWATNFEPGRHARYALLTIAVALTLLLGLVRVATEARFTFSLLLLLPTMMAAWYLGHRWGFAVASLAVGAWLVADLLAVDNFDSIDAYINAGVRAVVFWLVAAAFAALRAAHRQLNALAHSDALTGLANRRLFNATIEVERRRAARFAHPLSLASLDLDGFKALNDRRGHAAGDAVLVEVGRWLGEWLREVDCAARVGGDEFAIVLPECGPDAARGLAARLRDAWAQRAPHRRHGIDVSIGIVTFEPPPPSVDEMIAAADGAMYEAKREGKGTTRHRVVAAAETGAAPPDRRR
jgi:diguanylate cyclase (GGDEF)-like protein